MRIDHRPINDPPFDALPLGALPVEERPFAARPIAKRPIGRPSSPAAYGKFGLRSLSCLALAVGLVAAASPARRVVRRGAEAAVSPAVQAIERLIADGSGIHRRGAEGALRSI